MTENPKKSGESNPKKSGKKKQQYERNVIFSGCQKLLNGRHVANLFFKKTIVL